MLAASVWTCMHACPATTSAAAVAMCSAAWASSGRVHVLHCWHTYTVSMLKCISRVMATLKAGWGLPLTQIEAQQLRSALPALGPRVACWSTAPICCALSGCCCRRMRPHMRCKGPVKCKCCPESQCNQVHGHGPHPHSSAGSFEALRHQGCPVGPWPYDKQVIGATGVWVCEGMLQCCCQAAHTLQGLCCWVTGVNGSPVFRVAGCPWSAFNM